MSALKLRPTTRMAVQGAVAVGLVLFVNSLLGLERPYWGALMAVVVIAGSWGENLGKLKQLLLGTLGAVAGSLVFLAMTGRHPVPVLAVSLTCLFLWAYYAPVSYTVSCAWMGAFAIITVTFLQGGSNQIALGRGIQVILGGGLGILASAFILPVGAGGDLDRQIIDLKDFLRETVRRGFASFAEEHEDEYSLSAAIKIGRLLSKLTETGRTAVNEYIIFPARRREIAMRLNHVRRLSSYTTGLLESLTACRDGDLTPGMRAFFSAAANLLDRAFAAESRDPGNAVSPEAELGILRGLFTKEVSRRGEDFPRRDLAPYLMVFYYIRGIVETTGDVPCGLAAHPDGHTGGLQAPRR
ncbi:MAG: FUSC family protein [PVC group bacterium]